MTLAQIQTQIKNQVAKIEEQQQALFDSQKELSLLLEQKKIMQQVAYRKIKESEMISPEAENELKTSEQYNQNSLTLGNGKIDLEKSGFSIAEGQKELVNAITEKLDDFEFALSRLPVEERDYARVKLQSVIGNFINK